MKKSLLVVLLLSAFGIQSSCGRQPEPPLPGAWLTDQYSGLISGKRLAVVANQTSMVGKTHLVDTLKSLGYDIRAIFAPEHGFRGMADAGGHIEDGRDPSTGIPVISLYGKNFKPRPEDLEGIDAVLFDIQDVGARFYTYISTLHYVMEACAENNVECIVLDRPNPNGFYVDGNIPDTSYRSFVGMHPVPIVHGMTIGEYARMIDGEGWLSGGVRCRLTVVACRNYDHQTLYELPVRPSPNLPNQNSVYLYPSICFFEGTTLSLGRGTAFPFQVYGSPELPNTGFSFTPQSVSGATNPPLLGQLCYGTDLRDALANGLVPSPELNLGWVIDAYNNYPDKSRFFTRYFDVLAGGPELREQIRKGMSSAEIRETWKQGLENFAQLRSKYLLYK